MFITIINDCRDENAKARQSTKITSLFGQTPSFLGVGSDLEAAGNLIDIISSSNGAPGIILVNVAPRNAKEKKWGNGSPFGFFYYKKTLIVSSVSGKTLSLAQKLELIENLKLIDTDASASLFYQRKKISKEKAEQIKNTQFRSLEFSPLAAYFIYKKQEIASSAVPKNLIGQAAPSVWWVDNFGNCKTTLMKNELTLEIKKRIQKQVPGIKIHQRLKDVPDKEPALILGSSGLDKDNFWEIVIQGGSASLKYNIRSGQSLI